MHLPTYTSTFKVRRKLYAIYDWELPWALEIPQVVAFVVGLVVMVVALRVVHLHLGSSTAVFVVGIPAGLAWISPRAVADGKSAHVWLATQLVHLVEPRVLHDLRPGRGSERVEVAVSAWERRRTCPALALAPVPAVRPVLKRPRAGSRS